MGISTDPAGRNHPSALMADINKNKGVEFRSQQIAPQEFLISTSEKEKGIL